MTAREDAAVRQGLRKIAALKDVHRRMRAVDEAIDDSWEEIEKELERFFRKDPHAPDFHHEVQDLFRKLRKWGRFINRKLKDLQAKLRDVQDRLPPPGPLPPGPGPTPTGRRRLARRGTPRR